METRRKALILVDIQPGFITNENEWVIPNIASHLKNHHYDAYVEATFWAPEGSLWDKQMSWTFTKQDTVEEIKLLIPKTNHLFVEKITKSTFKEDKDVLAFLKKKGIEEVYIVGLDTNDCVLATAYESFDLGFLTYVIEHCTASSQSSELRDAALAILREQEMLR